MTMKVELVKALEQRLGARVLGSTPLSGGDINEAYRVDIEGGDALFVKTNPRASPRMFPAEARGLSWLGAANALKVPEVRAVSAPSDDVHYLMLDFIAPGKPLTDFDDRIGRGLAQLHAAGAPGYGLDHDNFIGSLEQSNTSCPGWADFYRGQRLEPQLRRAVETGRASYAMRRAFDRLFLCLADRVGPSEPPCRLHGDLWGGNLHIDGRGEPWLIDPAAYGGHREVDLAMMRLFGGFSERVFSVYDEAFPLAPEASARVALYQLYPLMVHVNLFGGSYVGSVERALSLYV